MTFYYPIPAGAVVTCRNCNAPIIKHLDTDGGWRGCPMKGNGDAVEVAGDAYPVFLVSTNRRRKERRAGADRRFFIPEQIGALHEDGTVTAPQTPVIVQLPQEQVQQAGPRPIVAGPRAAVYLTTPGARLTGQTGHTVKVFEAILSGGQQGKTAAELRKELRIKAKSLESVLYRLRLGGLIRAFNANDVRG